MFVKLALLRRSPSTGDYEVGCYKLIGSALDDKPIKHIMHRDTGEVKASPFDLIITQGQKG
eukprot:10539782-Prorocentrum_lima.AAC.1